MGDGFMLDTPEAIDRYALVARYHALRLETLGLRSRGGSVYALCKRAYGLRGSKAAVLEQLRGMIDAAPPVKVTPL